MTSVPVPNASATRADDHRLGYINNIRWSVILLVLSMHAADTYSPFGSWYYTDRTPLGRPEQIFFLFYQSFLQTFFMGLLFLIAGYFAVASLARRGRIGYVRERFARLGIPTLLYMFVVGPLTEYFVSKSWRTPKSFANAWWEHIETGEIWSQSGPLWFCAALFIFSAVYAVVGHPGRFRPTPASCSVTSRDLLGLIAILAVTTFAVRVFVPPGKSFFNFQLADFPQYITLYVVGIAASGHRWFSSLDGRLARQWALGVLVVGTLSWTLLLVLGGAFQGNVEAYESGLHWQNAGMSLWSAITCVGMVVGYLAIFRDRFNWQTRLTTWLSDNAFAVYVFHPPILIGLALALHGLQWNGVPKFVLLTLLSAMATFAASALVLRRIPLLRRVL